METEEILNKENEMDAQSNENDEQQQPKDASNEQASDTELTADEEQKAASEETESDDPLDIALREIEVLKDKYLRQVAEFDNYRKRTLKERAELILNGGEKVITSILPVLDDMERAIDNGQKTDDPEVLREGMLLIHQKIEKILEAQGLSIIATDDEDFNTDVHEAVAMVPGMGDDKKGKVIDCIQKGYKLNDKVIRHAKVAVGA